MEPKRAIVSLSSGLALAATLVACLLLAANQAAAQGIPGPREPLTISLTIKKIETDAQGNELLVDAAAFKPGELLEYVAVYANVGDQPLDDLQATLPLPGALEYQGGSAKPSRHLASTDGVSFAAEPLMRPVSGGEGKAGPVPFAEYRFLRWQIPVLEPGTYFMVRARARVSRIPEQILPESAGTSGEASGKGGGS